MADDNPIFQMVGDPDFAKMPVSEQRKALSAHDSSFGQVGDDELNKFVQAHQRAHTGMPAGDLQAAHEAAAHTAPGTLTDQGSRMRQISGPPGALMNPREFLNMNEVTSTMGRRTPGIENVDPYTPLKEESNRRFAAGEPRGAAGMITDTADMASSMTTPTNLALMGAGGLTELAPAAGLITKLPMLGASALFAGEGAKDIYDAATDDQAEPADRLRKGFLGGAGVAGGIAGLGEISPGPAKVGPIETGMGEAGVRGMFNKKMDIAAPNEPFTPRELLQTAKEHGINLDIADATGHGLAIMTKKPLQYSLGGTMPFIRNQQQNMLALEQWGETAGGRILDSLNRDYEMRKSGASQEFEDLDKRVGPNTIDGTQTVEAEAVKIRDGMKTYYGRHPELVPKQAWAIVNDLAERPAMKSVQGNKTTMVPLPKHEFSWSELHQLRSDLMDIYRNNPDLVKSRADSWLQQMVKTIDDTMTGAASQLTPADQAQFRAANATWDNIKSTYDNPQNPLYHAVRAQNASQVPGMLLKQKAPEFSRGLQTILGPEFNELRQFGGISKLVSDNPNPSGSARMAIPGAEAGTHITTAKFTGGASLPGSAAMIGGEYGLSKLLNSPRVVEHLTDPRTARAMPRGLPIAAGATTMNDAEDSLARRLLRGGMAGPR